MFRGARALTGAAALAVALAAAPPAAQAEVRQVYDALFAANVTYAVDEANESGTVTRRTAASFVVSGWFRDLRFLDGTLQTQRMATEVKLSRGESGMTYVNREVDPVDTTVCEDRAPRLVLPGVLNPLRAFDRDLPGRAIGLTPIAMATFDLACGVGGMPLGLGAVSHRPGDVGPGHLRAELLVPREQLGDSEIALRYDRQWGDVASCPGGLGGSDLRTCTTRLRGTLTLTRTDKEPEPEDDLLAPLAPPSRPKLDRGARRARSSARCPRGCDYEIRVFLAPRGGRGRLGKSAAASPRVIARASGRLPAARAARSLAVTIPPRWRPAVLAAGGALVRVALDQPRGRGSVAIGFASAR